MNHSIRFPAAGSGARRTRPVACTVLLGAACLALSACGSSTPVATSSSQADETAPATAVGPDQTADATGSATSATAPTAAASAGATAPGYAPGEAPPVPLFTLPDMGLLAAGDGALTSDQTATVDSVPGVTVSPARCDQSGGISAGSTGTVLISGGPAAPDSGGSTAGASSSDGGATVVDNGNGSGSYTNGTTKIVTNGDGSGTYVDATLSVTVNTDGSGTSTNSATGENIVVNSNGSGSYKRGSVSIVNNGDGTGSYTDGALSIVNHGDGTALVNGRSTAAKPLPPVGKVGSFPGIEAVRPVRSCGTAISLDSSILFDVDSYQVRPESSELLSSLAQVLTQAGAPKATVAGHTDSVADEAYNQTLSEQRAQAVVDALRDAGATTELTAVGYGESRPVAPNTTPDGSDDPAGRQLNRRVEIMIPVF
ncbi:OmpA family protein [Actinomyces israelii]|uniref:OmpA family protein n=1 Tax=Actinomyces israelii TaxID=1659 RepID=UPI00235306C1|nr:OmpA family protein [Actinomyces israelii]